MTTLLETAFPVSIPFPDASDWDVEPDWDAAFDRPFPEDEVWWVGELAAREFLSGRGPLPADLEEAARISRWQDLLDAGCVISDQDIEAVGLAAG